MEKYENKFYLKLYQDNDPQQIKQYVLGLCKDLNDRGIDFHLDLYLDTMFDDEVYTGGRGPTTTYPYVNFEKTFDNITDYFTFDIDALRKRNDVSSQSDEPADSVDATPLEDETIMTNTYSDDGPTMTNTHSEDDTIPMHTCQELLSKLPVEIKNEVVLELKITTDTPQFYYYGGITQLEYFLNHLSE